MINPWLGWYRGDLHTHTNASDGVYPASVLAEMAEAEGLDFLAITNPIFVGPPRVPRPHKYSDFVDFSGGDPAVRPGERKEVSME